MWHFQNDIIEIHIDYIHSLKCVFKGPHNFLEQS